MHQEYIEAEYFGGGPRDGEVTHVYSAEREQRFIVPRTDVFYASANMPTHTELFHVYRLDANRGLERQRIWYRYEGYTV